jgi:hypothetical protein
MAYFEGIAVSDRRDACRTGSRTAVPAVRKPSAVLGGQAGDLSYREAWLEAQRGHPPRLLGKPQPAHQRYLHPASRPLASDRPRPEIGNRCRSIRVLRIELGQFLFRFLLDPGAPLAHLVGQALAVLGDVFEDDLVEQNRNRVQVAGEGVSPNAQGFQRNRAAAGEGVHDQRPRTGCPAQGLVRGLGEGATGVQVFLDRRVIPIGEVGDEVEQRMAQFDGIV